MTRSAGETWGSVPVSMFTKLFKLNICRFCSKILDGTHHIILQHDTGVFAALVHLQTGSLTVPEGARVRKGDFLGRVGHSGNSYTPHLHFQLMDSSDIASANGLPCTFERYEVLREEVWETVHNGIPTDKERIRFIS